MQSPHGVLSDDSSLVVPQTRSAASTGMRGRDIQHFPAAHFWLLYLGPQFWAKAVDAASSEARRRESCIVGNWFLLERIDYRILDNGE